MRKHIRAFIPIIIMAVLLVIPLRVSADDDMFKDKKCVLPITAKVVYDGGEQILRNGYGILVDADSEGNGARNLIAIRSFVYISDEEIASVCTNLGLNEDQRKSAKGMVEVTVEGDIKIKADFAQEREGKNLALLELETPVYDQGGLIFDKDEDAVTSGQELIVLESDGVTHRAVVDSEGEVSINGVLYVQFDSQYENDEEGYAVFNTNGEFLGMIYPSADGIHKNALSAKEIYSLLNTMGIKINVADHTVPEIDKKALITATDIADKLDLSLYTEESGVPMKEAIENARSVIISDEATQQDVDDAKTLLLQAQDNLVLQKGLDKITIIFMIVAGVLLLGIIVMIIVLIALKKRRKKKELAKEELESKKAPVANGPFVPSGKKKTNDSKKESRNVNYTNSGNSQPANKAYNSSMTSVTRNTPGPQVLNTPEPSESSVGRGQSGSISEKLSQGDNPRSLEGFAPSSKSITFNEEDTTVLSAIEQAAPAAPQIKRPYLLMKDESRIEIIRDSFVLGKSAQKADWIVDSKAVSREHLRITKKDDNYYATDLSSLNGSFINGTKLNPHEDYILNDGDSLKLADIEYTFHKE